MQGRVVGINSMKGSSANVDNLNMVRYYVAWCCLWYIFSHTLLLLSCVYRPFQADVCYLICRICSMNARVC